MHVFIAISILALTPPMTGAAIILFDVAHPPRIRSTLGLGMTVILSAFAFGMLGVSAALIEGRQPFFPYAVVTGLPALTVARMMQIEVKRQVTV